MKKDPFKPEDRPLEEMLMEIAQLTTPADYFPIMKEYMVAVHDLKLNKYYVLGQLYSRHNPYQRKQWQ